MRLIGLAVVHSLTLASLAGDAQQPAGLPRIGFLTPSSSSEPRSVRFVQAFRNGLLELGYVEGQNVAIEFRWAEGKYDRLPDLAAELVRLKVNVIVAGGTPAVQAAKQATATIPIVMATVADPVAQGFVASLARPGGNITGLSLMWPELVGKQLELLKQVVPGVSLVALLGNPGNPNNAQLVQQAQDAARALGVRLRLLGARGPGEIDSAFAAITAEPVGGVIVTSDTMLIDHRTRIADHAVRRRLPTVFGPSQFAEAGGLLAYGPSLSDDFRRAAVYVDRILRGAKPADLPVEQPTKFELVTILLDQTQEHARRDPGGSASSWSWYFGSTSTFTRPSAMDTFTTICPVWPIGSASRATCSIASFFAFAGIQAISAQASTNWPCPSRGCMRFWSASNTKLKWPIASTKPACGSNSRLRPVVTVTTLPSCVVVWWNAPVTFSVTCFEGSSRFVSVASRPGDVKMKRSPGRSIVLALPVNKISTPKAHTPPAGIVMVWTTSVGGFGAATESCPKTNPSANTASMLLNIFFMTFVLLSYPGSSTSLTMA
jgi:putative tryptophan/tyrosine transport system substrate-binding protein